MDEIPRPRDTVPQFQGISIWKKETDYSMVFYAPAERQLYLGDTTNPNDTGLGNLVTHQWLERTVTDQGIVKIGQRMVGESKKQE
jgi:hypothetical protein